MAATAALMMATQSLTGAYAESEALRAQGDYQKRQSEINAQIDEQAADDAVARGQTAAQMSAHKTKSMASSQKAAGAAAGLDTTTGSVAEGVADTNVVGAVDVMNIKVNAWREAYGYKTSAIAQRTEGEIAQIAGRGAARRTLLGGGARALAYGASAFKKTDTGEVKLNQRQGNLYMTSQDVF